VDRDDGIFELLIDDEKIKYIIIQILLKIAQTLEVKSKTVLVPRFNNDDQSRSMGGGGNDAIASL